MKAEAVEHLLVDIRHRVIQRPDRDIPNPELLPSFFNGLLAYMGRVAQDGVVRDGDGKDWIVPPAKEWAQGVLMDLWNHASAGVPWGEARDTYAEMVLDADERGGR